ncbi:DUF1445 domain-containing protein [Moraxella caviae]|uniref:Putative hydro-lyase B0181_03710 n=1 Tax=Moraxella caviae TaxID=34060 RepID=A0A1T0A6U3_9GAMM|nr:putative hydro-lyase [Moraxella caviae]OOR91051.1 DUF1445 domain-containing protein [Moraxella caviae]STZ14258.1 Uncharacterized conserved protein [Moraxella caviae]VEW12919.1 Uncharacterized conserved protein [Moraxella caviae]
MQENAVNYATMPPKDLRQLFREGCLNCQTSGMSLGYAQANMVVLPQKYAYDFLLFAQRNPKPCPILEVGDVGSPWLQSIAKDCNVASDLPKYRIYEHGKLVGEFDDVQAHWRDDLVAFLIGCSFSFESELLDSGVSVRHIEEGRNVPMYQTNIACNPAGIFSGNMVVSMRPLPPEQIVTAVNITAAMPRVHGTPVHIGNPEYIGITDIQRPDFGEMVTIHEHETPVFWACGVTPQSIVMNSKPDFCITHAPGHMLITDVKNANLKF